MEPLLWERAFDRHPPDHVWLQRIAETLALGFGRLEELILAAGFKDAEPPPPEAWFWWRKPADSSDARPAAGSGAGVASEDEIKAAWGPAYETLRAEHD